MFLSKRLDKCSCKTKRSFVAPVAYAAAIVGEYDKINTFRVLVPSVVTGRKKCRLKKHQINSSNNGKTRKTLNAHGNIFQVQTWRCVREMMTPSNCSGWHMTPMKRIGNLYHTTFDPLANSSRCTLATTVVLELAQTGDAGLRLAEAMHIGRNLHIMLACAKREEIRIAL